MLFLSFTVSIIALLALALGFLDPDLFSSLFGEKKTKLKAVSVFGVILFLALLGVVFNLEKLETTSIRTVARVIDGDTVELASGARVRLIGIDAPEIGKPYANEAKKELQSLILGKQVRLERDVSERDDYGRLLRYIWHADTLINEEMVRRGLARAYSYPPDIKHQERLRSAENKAKEEKRGLWVDK